MQILHDPRILNFWSLEEKKNGDRQEGKYLPKKNIWFVKRYEKRRRKRRKIQDGIYFFAEEKKQRGNRRKILGEGKSSFGDDENNGERKG